MDDDTTDTVSAPPESRHVSVWMNVAPEVVYEIACDIEQMPRWAAGLADPALGDVDVRFVGDNQFGVLDHVVRLPSGTEVYNPMRILPDAVGRARCEVVFTVRRLPEMTDEQFDADAAAVFADLQALKRLVGG